MLRGLLLVLAIGSTGFVHAHIDTSASDDPTQLRVPDPERAKLTSFGFDPVVADFYWVQALHLVGGLHGNVPEHGGTIGDVIELVTTLDPWVSHPYRFAAVWMTGTLDDVRRANALLRKAVSYHPDDWRNRFHLGYNRFFYLQDNAAAADVLEPAIDMDGAPNYLGAFVARLRADGGDLETAALFLESLIENAPDEYVKAEYLKAYDEIETERRARLLDEARVVFWKRQGRDVRDPSELWEGPARVIRRMPPPHPHFPGFAWALDEETNEIVSTFYKTRYRLHIHGVDVELREQWRRQLAREEGE
ncbi:MAG: tetratricopeptide repeat protein [Myxococcota bacterium]